jgi:hypothetical protein
LKHAGSIFGSLVRTDEVHTVAAPRIKAALKSPAVLQRGESPVPENYENQRRDHGDKIRDRPALGTFVAIFARLPAHGMRVDFVWSRCSGGHPPILGPRRGLGQRLPQFAPKAGAAPFRQFPRFTCSPGDAQLGDERDGTVLKERYRKRFPRQSFRSALHWAARSPGSGIIFEQRVRTIGLGRLGAHPLLMSYVNQQTDHSNTPLGQSPFRARR